MPRCVPACSYCSFPNLTQRKGNVHFGDVVSNPSFIKRMREYVEEGVEYLYFMMLQKDEVSETPFRSTHPQ
jgi:hypothetical protein